MTSSSDAARASKLIIDAFARGVLVTDACENTMELAPALVIGKSAMVVFISRPCPSLLTWHGAGQRKRRMHSSLYFDRLS